MTQDLSSASHLQFIRRLSILTLTLMLACAFLLLVRPIVSSAQDISETVTPQDKSAVPTPTLTVTAESKSSMPAPAANEDRVQVHIASSASANRAHDSAVEVIADAQWVNTGLTFTLRDPLSIVATGAWRPGGPQNDLIGPDGSTISWADNFLNLQDIGTCGWCARTSTPHWAALIGYIGDATPPGPGSYTSTSVLSNATRIFVVGSHFVTRTLLSGTLWLNFNDDAYSGNTGDNAGQASVSIVKRWNPDDQHHDKGCPLCGNEESQDYAGDPINTATGNFNYQATDLSIATAGSALRFERSYNSLTITGTAGYSRPLGYGWTHNYDVRLTFPDDLGGEPETVIFKIPHGSRARFKDLGSGTYEPWPGVRATLTRSLTSPYVYTVTAVNHESYAFTAAGRLIRHSDPYGNQTTLTYQSGVTLTRVTGPGDTRWLDLSYDNLGRLTAITDHTGRSVGYGYNLSNDLIVVTDTRGLTWTYTYTGSHLLSALVEPTGQFIERVAYDEQGRAVRQEDGLGNPIITIDYSLDGGRRVVTERGRVVTDTYSADNLWLGQASDAGSTASAFDDFYNRTSSTDGNGHTTQYERTALGLTTAVVDALEQTTQLAYVANNLSTYTDPAGNTTHFEYDANNNLLAQTDALSHTTHYAYDQWGHVISTTTASGQTTQSAYDEFGQQAVMTAPTGLVTYYGHDALGRLITTTAPGGLVTINAYDNADQLIRVTANYTTAGGQNYLDEYNLITTYGYDPAGRQVAITDTVGHVTRNEYDAAGRLTVNIQNYLAGEDQNYLNQYNIVTRYGYDSAGRQVLVTDTLGFVTKTDYDSLSRPVLVTANYSTTFNSETNVTRTLGYDASGNVITQTDALGRMTVTRYDAVNRPMTVTTNFVDGVYDPSRPDEDLATVTEYDEAGRASANRDAAGNWSYSAYDELGRLITSTNALSGTVVNVYDASGRHAASIDPAGNATRYGYDAAGRLITTTNALSGTTVTIYDGLGRRVATRDALDHRTVYTYSLSGRLLAAADANGAETKYGYDVLGRTVVVTDALGQATHTAYDELGRAVTVTNALSGTLVTQYDALGRRTRSQDARGQWTTFAYDTLGRVITTTDATGQAVATTYDRLGQVTQTSVCYQPTAACQVQSRFDYDGMGRLIAQSDALTNTTRLAYDALGNRVVVTAANGVETRYGYDALGRLITVTENYSATGPSDYQTNLVTRYGYDAVGNRRIMTNARGYTTTYTYDALGRVVSVVDPLGHGTQYEYDAVGSRTVVTDANHEVTRYAYDAMQRPRVITYTADLTIVQYAYDALGNRLAMTDAVGTTHYAYDALNRPITVSDPFGQMVGYVYDANGNRTRLIYPDGRVVTTTYDAVNQLTSVLDWSGGMTVYEYDGAHRLISATLPNDVRTTYQYDDANRLIRLRHTRMSDNAVLADYQFALDQLGNRSTVTETVLTPDAESELGLLPATTAEEVVQAVTGHRPPGLSGLATVHTVASDQPDSTVPSGLGVTSIWPPVVGPQWPIDAPLPSTRPTVDAAVRNVTTSPEPIRLSTRFDLNIEPKDADTVAVEASQMAEPGRDSRLESAAGNVNRPAPVKATVWMPLLAPGDIFSDSFEAGNFSAWSAAVTNTGRLSVTTSATRWGAYGLRALITSTTAMYVRNDTPNAEARYRARFYFSTNSITMATNNAHELFIGRNVTGTNIFTAQLSYASGNYRVMAEAVNDSTGISSTAWYPISNTWHFIEIDWKASTSTTAKNGYITLWIDGVQKESKSGIDNDTRRVDEVRLGPLSGIDSGTNGTELFDAFESRQSTYIGPVALADFTASPLSGTAPLTVTFTNTSQPTATLTAYLWKFGDGYTSTITNPVHAYLPGYYTVTLTAWNGVYSDTITKTRLITATVKADFSANPVSGTAPLTVTFTNASQPASALTAYLWKFGDGYTSTITNPVHTYAPGYYTVTLTASSGVLTDTITKTRWITATIKANFSASPISGTAPLTVTFTNTSQPSSAMTAYLWNFGDGYTSSITNPVHSYPQGYYTVTLTARAGTLTDILTQTRCITVQAQTQVQANFSASPISGTAPLTVTFTNTSQPTPTITAYAWNFGDGYTSTITQPVHSYLPGYYTVTLTAWAGASSNTVTKTRFITATLKADFTSNPGQGLAPLTVTLTNTSQPASGVTSYLWNFGDGYTSTITNPVHLYSSPGYFTVTLTARSGSMQDTLTKTQCVTATLLAGFTASPVEGYLPLTVTFANTSQPPAGLTAYRWNFGDGYTSTITNPVHAYGPAGTFTVTLTAWAGPMQDTVTKTNFITTTDNTPVSGDFVIGHPLGSGSGPDTLRPAYNSVQNEYLVVWHEYNVISGDYIVGQRLTGNGHLLGARIIISNGLALAEPDVTYDPVRNQYLVIWSTSLSADNVVQGRFVAANGTLGALITVSDAPGDMTSGASLAYNSAADAYLVAWYGYADEVGVLWQQRVAGAGTLSGINAAMVETDNSLATEVVANPTDEQWLIAWDDGATIAAQRVASNGAPIGSVVTVANRPNDEPSFAVDVTAAGDYLVVWQDGQDIRGQRVTANGNLSGSALAIGVVADTAQENPTVAYRPEADEFLVVWQDDRNGLDYDLYSAYVSAAGEVLNGGFTLVEADNDQLSPAIVYAQGAQTFLLVWRDHRYTPQIYGRRWLPPVAGFDITPPAGLAPLTVTFTNQTTPTLDVAYHWDFGDGEVSTEINPTHTYALPGLMDVALTATRTDGLHIRSQAVPVNPQVGQAVVVAADPAASEDVPALAYDAPDQQYLAVWTAWDGQTDLYARRIMSTGLPMGAVFPIRTGAGEQHSPAVVYGHGIYLVVWNDSSSVWGQRVLPSGVLTGTSFVIGTGGTDNTAPAVDYNPVSDEFLTVWVNSNNGNRIHARRISTAGGLLGTPIEVPATSNGLMPSVAHDAWGNYLIAFLYDENLDGFAVWGQRLSGGGALWGDAFPIYSAPSNSTSTQLAYNPRTAEYLVVWREAAGGASDEVYMRRVSSAGTVIGNALALGAQSGEPDSPKVACQPDSNTYLVVWSDQRNGDWDAYMQIVEADGTLRDDARSLEATTANQTRATVSPHGANDDLLIAYIDDSSGSPDLYAKRHLNPVTAQFSGTPLTGIHPLTVTFTDQSTALDGTITSWAWDFGDGYTSTQQHPTHVYPMDGAYTVRLSVSTGSHTALEQKPDYVTALVPHQVVLHYTYDGLNRLTKATTRGIYSNTFEYAYDAVGNRTIQTATITSTQTAVYQYDAANRLASVNGQAYTWDDNGNLLHDGQTQYAYDQANRLTAISGSGVTGTHAYNGDGARLKQIVNGTVTTYTLDLAAPLVQVLVAKDNSGDTRYLYGITRIGEQQVGGWVYHLTDALGSVRQLADGNGLVTLARGYTPYGEPLWSQGGGQSVYGYTGEALDTYIKLVFLRTRYYSPDTARFLSKDVWQGDYTRPQSLNAWMYVEGNPVNRTDPSGQSTCYPWDGRCKRWIEQSLEVISTGGPLSHDFINRFYADSNTMYWFLGNDSDYVTLPVIPFVDYIVLAQSWLSDPLPPPISHIQWFVHEIVHSFRNPAERTTIFGEVEAYTVQAQILQELGRGNLVTPFMQKLINDAVQGGQVSRNFTDLAKARCTLISAFRGGPQEGVYSSIALLFDHGLSYFQSLVLPCFTCPTP